MKNKEDRFQNQPWYIKIWRYRHYLPIPYKTLRLFIFDKTKENRHNSLWVLSLCQAYSVIKGEAQMRMNWLYEVDMNLYRETETNDQ